MSIPVLNDLHKKFRFLKLLGEGSFANVYQVKRDGVQYALKMIHSNDLEEDEKTARKLLREFNILTQLDHPNIIKCHEHFQSIFISKLHYCLLLDYVHGVTLKQYLRRNPLRHDEIEYITLNLIESVNYLHLKGIIHRDIKPDNIIYNSFDKTVILLDFGLATFLGKEPEKKSEGTPLYMAPEIINNQLENFSNLDLTDVWSLGVCVYFINYRKEPYNARSVARFRKLMKIVPNLKIDEEIPIKVRKVILKSLVQDVKQRANIKDLLNLWEYH